MNTPSQPNREERFDKKFEFLIMSDHEYYSPWTKDLKKFIEEEVAQALAEQRDGIVKMIDEKRGKLTRTRENSPAFNITNDIIASINAETP